MTQTLETWEGFHKPGKQRVLPGTKEEDSFIWSYDNASSNNQLYLQTLIRSKRFDIDILLEQPSFMDELSWLYEHMRQICIELGFYVSVVHIECTEKQCPVMRAQETTYYCAGHGSPRPCSAIGYAVHTLDYAVRQLSQGDNTSLKHLQSMVRRLYRIFAHVYFHHRQVFETQETATYLYARFVRLARKYELAPESQIIIPELPTTV
ncbi:hypothetical protein FB645_004969 [Coemansia sp. IMI 203386]|nr:hypothetical protein FB645_004969 [Coemansia sp. IMI 203386]